MTDTDRTSILIVDDKKENLLALEGCLEDFEVNIVKAMSGDEALARMLDEDFALVLLDVQMPGIDGFETARLMRGIERTRQVPIIFVTANNKELTYIFQGYETGAVDFLFNPLDTHILKSKVAVFVQLHQQKNELRKTIDQLHHANQKIREISIRDGLTGCYNRTYLNEQLPKEIKRALRYSTSISLIMTDIDYFKRVNDTHGHLCGDNMLISFVERIGSIIRKDLDWIARYGGEEFVFVLPETGLPDAVITAEKMRKAINDKPILYQGKRITISASFGVSTLTSSHLLPERIGEKMLFMADKGLYAAKAQGRNRVVTGKEAQ